MHTTQGQTPRWESALRTLAATDAIVNAGVMMVDRGDLDWLDALAVTIEILSAERAKLQSIIGDAVARQPAIYSLTASDPLPLPPNP